MLPSLVFLAVGIALYLLADRALIAAEGRLGRRLPYRSLIFFALLLASTLLAFAILRTLFAT